MPNIQLTTLGAVIPYGICLDDDDHFWIASKGGLFKIDQNGQCLFMEKHDRPKAMSAFSSVNCATTPNGDLVIFTKFAEGNSEETHLVLHKANGERTATNIIDGVVKTATMTSNGDIFFTITRNKNTSFNEIVKTNVDDFYTTKSITSSPEFAFLHIAAFAEHGIVAVSAATTPVTPYSKQIIQLYDYNTGELLRSFGEMGKENGQLWCPRALNFDSRGNLLILDKTGRIQKFSAVTGEYINEMASMPAGLANGFCLNRRENRVYIACSGLVEETIDDRKEIVCNDWIEEIDIKP